MEFCDLPAVFREAFACHEAFRKLGFESDDIFVMTDAGRQVGMVLRTQGKEFTVILGFLPGRMTREEFETLWVEASECVNSKFSKEDLDQMYENSGIFQHRESLVRGLALKGFSFPRSMNWEVQR